MQCIKLSWQIERYSQKPSNVLYRLSQEGTVELSKCLSETGVSGFTTSGFTTSGFISHSKYCTALFKEGRTNVKAA
jgi:hypothetical protein